MFLKGERGYPASERRAGSAGFGRPVGDLLTRIEGAALRQQQSRIPLRECPGDDREKEQDQTEVEER
jgi:hypothetical protein